MSLRARLTAACAAVALIPLLVVGVVVGPLLARGSRDHAQARLLSVTSSVAATVAARCASGCPSLLGTRAGLESLVGGTGVSLTVLRDGGLVVSTLSPVAATQLAGRDRSLAAGTELTGSHMTSVLSGPSGALLVLTAAGPGLAPLVLALLLAALLVVAASAGIARVASRRASRPLQELADAASRVAAGDLDVRMAVTANDENGQLAAAFNMMTTELRRQVGELQASRDELRRNLARFGDTLSQTHNLPAILDVILDTAMANVQAEGGALLLTNSESSHLYLTAGRGLEGRMHHAPTSRGTRPRVRIGRHGVTGRVAATGEDMRVVTGNEAGQVMLADDEPAATSVISVPLRSSGRVTGVLNLYDRKDGRAFDEADLETIRTFAGQAAAAIENVLLHHEAQRLSVTDGLTGLWNYRYLTTALANEVERSTRFGRPLALLFLDLDRFKDVNDVYGHQRGDSVLYELAGRVRSVVREVDVVARYGGEELVLLLPETDLEGAVQLAERVWSAVRSQPFGAAGEEPIRVTTSLGIAVFPLHGPSAVALLRAADKALFSAKRAGRDCWKVAHADMAVSDGTGAA